MLSMNEMSVCSLGYYYIYWTTTGEESPPIYTAIKKSKI